MGLRTIGMILCALGCLGGALAASMSPDAVEWAYFAPGFVVGAIGVTLARIGISRTSKSSERLAQDFKVLDASMARVVATARKLEADKLTIDTYAIPQRIDDELAADLAAFAEAREAIAPAWGTNVYAAIMSHFAAGERYMNRVWSAAADGYVDEARAYIARALEQFVATLEPLEGLKTRPALSQRARR
jgi:hypothetical protein